jgi:hypothetical protein
MRQDEFDQMLGHGMAGAMTGVTGGLARTAVSPRLAAGEMELGAGGGRRAAAEALPMDEASRLARAREMGFDVDYPLYHGTSKSFDEFKIESPGYNSNLFGSEPTTRAAIFVAEHPGLAKEFADQGGKNGSVMELLSRTENTLGASKYGFPVLPESFFEKHGLNHRYYYGMQPWETWQAFDVPNGGREFVKALQDEGYDSARLMDVAAGDVPNTTSMAIFDPSMLRKKAAAFDPGQASSSNLMASHAAPLIGIGGAVGINDILSQYDSDR